MIIGKPITVQLGAPLRPYAIRWTKRAEARNSSLPRPQSFSALARPRNRLGAVTTLIWAALVERDHEFEAPEDIAEFFTTSEQQIAAIKAISEMVREAFPEKKSVVNEDSSASGPVPSSNAASAPPASTGGT